MLHEGEKILFQGKPEKSILVLWFFTKCLGFCFIVGFLILWASLFFGGIFQGAIKGQEQPSFWFIIPTLIIALPTCFLISIVYCIALRETYNYYVTNERCIFEGGIIVKKKRSIPYHKITDAEIYQNIIERILNIYRLNLFTPGTASMWGAWGGQRAEIVFAGLKDAQKPEEIITNILKTYRSTGE